MRRYQTPSEQNIILNYTFIAFTRNINILHYIIIFSVYVINVTVTLKCHLYKIHTQRIIEMIDSLIVKKKKHKKKNYITYK